jgi:hypothetical protein
MMKSEGPTPEMPADRVDASTPQGDWPVEQIKQFTRELYIHFPFDDEDMERLKDLVRNAFWVFDNLDEACKEILTERSEGRRERARQEDAKKKLPRVAPFDKAVRYITGEKHTNRARSKFDKLMSYEARIIPFEREASPNLSAKQKREIEGQLEKWRQNGIPRAKVLKLQSRFEHYWPLVLAEQNSANVRKRAKRTDKRRGAKPPEFRSMPTSFGNK